MLNRREKKWSAVKRYISTVLFGIIRKRVRIEDASGEDMGFTRGDNAIYISDTHAYFEKISEEEKRTMQLGIAVHEAMHMVFTNFDYLNTKVNSMIEEGVFQNDYERNMFVTIWNLIEDPAIESHAHEKCGGTALRALYYEIEKCHAIGHSFGFVPEYPIQELVNALVDFGDVGIIPGDFVFTEAQECFNKIAPAFYEAINEPNNKKRIDMAYPIFLEIRPLWKTYPENMLADLFEKLKELFEKMAKDSGEDSLYRSGTGKDGAPSSENSFLNRKRKITIKRVSRDEYERLKKESEEKEGETDLGGDIEIVISEDLNEDDLKDASEEKGKGSAVPIPGLGENSEERGDDEAGDANGSGDGPKQDREGDTSPDEGSGAGPDDEPGEEMPGGKSSSMVDIKEKDDTKESGEDAPGYDAAGRCGSSTEPSGSGEGSFEASEEMADEGSLDNTSGFDMTPGSNPHELSEEESGLIEDYDYQPEVSEEDIMSILSGIEKEEAEHSHDDEESDSYYEPIPEMTESISQEFPQFERVRAVNRYIEDGKDLSDEYDEVIENLSEYIEPLKDELKDIFYDDRVKKIYSESGKVNLKRVATKKTLTVFERRLQPDHKDDVCFCVVVDNSGSTSGEKVKQEKIACIGIAEALAEFGIPLYVFSFQTFYSEGDTTQTHYVRWDNTRFERERLLCMKANGGNFDSYSIRYATKLLQERKERKKILIVISDGCPTDWFSGYEGIKQNRLAIEDARVEKMHVLGIGVGNVDDSSFTEMYTKDYYMKVQQPSDLFDNLADRIVKFIDEGE